MRVTIGKIFAGIAIISAAALLWNLIKVIPAIMDEAFYAGLNSSEYMEDSKETENADESDKPL